MVWVLNLVTVFFWLSDVIEFLSFLVFVFVKFFGVVVERGGI